MAQQTRLGLWGVSARPYAAFVAKVEAPEPPEDVQHPKGTPAEAIWSRQAVGGGAAGMLSDVEIEHERHARKADIASLKAEVARLVLGDEPAPAPLPRTKKARKARTQAARAAERQPQSTTGLARRAARQSRLLVARAEIARLRVEVERIEAVALERGIIEREAMRDEDEALALLMLGM